MKTVKEIQFASDADAMEAAQTRSMASLFPDGLPRWTYVYVSDDAKIVAASVPSDATPSDELFFMGRYV